MNNFGEQINSIIDNLANKLGVAAEKIYPALRRQAVIDGVGMVLILLLGVIMLIASIIVFKKVSKYRYCNNYNEDNAFLGYMGAVVLLAVGILIFAAKFNEMLTALFNPDYYIINEIISKLK